MALHQTDATMRRSVTVRVAARPTFRAAEPWSFTFGPYLVFSAQRTLLRCGQYVKLGSRAFDLLVALATRAGDVVSQPELMAIVWPTTYVEESSVRVQLRLLRQALGDRKNGARYIETLSGRGYCFVAPVVINWTAPELEDVSW